METRLILANQKSVGQLLSLMRAYYEYDDIEFDLEKARGAVLQLISEEKLGRIWLIEKDTVTVGYLALSFGFSLEFGGRDAFIDEFFLLDRYRNQGIGKAALQLVEQMLSQLSIRALHLEVDRENSAAKNFYTARGFQSRAAFHLMSKKL